MNNYLINQTSIIMKTILCKSCFLLLMLFAASFFSFTSAQTVEELIKQGDELVTKNFENQQGLDIILRLINFRQTTGIFSGV